MPMIKINQKIVMPLLFLGIFVFIALFSTGYKHASHAQVEQTQATPPPMNADMDIAQDNDNNESYKVQAVLNAQDSAVISGAVDGVLKNLPFESGDIFKKGDILAEYDCRFEKAKHQEAHAQHRISKRQAEAYKRLKKQDVVADVDFVSVSQELEKANSVLEQTRARLSLCTIKAPFNGRITDLTANNYEAVKSGRVLMEIASLAPLQAELLVPSIWLRWLNIGKTLDVSIHETGKTYRAKVRRINGKVDPVTQTAYVVVKLNEYREELLPGMSGIAVFDKSDKTTSNGFIGLKLGNSE